jgi:hypothetical protein
MWLILIFTVIAALAWMTEPKKNAIPIRNESHSRVLPGNDLPAGGISRLLDS